MDQLKAQFWQLGTLYLAAIVVIVTFFIRRVVEEALPWLKKVADESDPKPIYKNKLSEWWNAVILYLLPVATGATGAACFPSYFASGKAAESTGNAIMFGMVIGWCSSFLYKVIRKGLKKKTGIDLTPGPIDPTAKDSDVDAKGEDDEPAKAADSKPVEAEPTPVEAKSTPEA